VNSNRLLCKRDICHGDTASWTCICICIYIFLYNFRNAFNQLTIKEPNRSSTEQLEKLSIAKWESPVKVKAPRRCPPVNVAHCSNILIYMYSQLLLSYRPDKTYGRHKLNALRLCLCLILTLSSNDKEIRSSLDTKWKVYKKGTK